MAERRRVFIAYARADIAHAEQMRGFLTDNGFSPILERADITPEDARQSTLVRSADAVVLMLTDRSTDNSKCEWEVSEAARLGKPIIAVLPEPLRGDPLPAGMAQVSYIHFYSDPAISGSGWFDGQRRLKAELTQLGRGRAPLPSASRAPAPPPPLMPSRFRTREPERRVPIQSRILLALIIVGVGAFAISTDLRAQARGLWRQALDAVAELAPREQGPTGAAAVSAQDYTPERAATATRGGANVRDYPLLSGDLITNLPEGTALNITGRLEVQGKWWFRVVLDDGQIGFVREDVVRWGRRAPAATTTQNPTPTPAPAEVAGVQTIEPARSAVAGPAGARVRTAPGTNAPQVVRLAANAPVTVTGRLRQGQHWWLRVQLQDGRIGFARDDVLRTPEGAAFDAGD
jgi:hypothetical protein